MAEHDELWDDADNTTPTYVEPTEERGVRRDTFDRLAWEMLLGTTPSLRNQVDAFERDYETSRPAHEDLFNLLNQGDPRFVDDAAMLPDYLPQKHMLERSFTESLDFLRLREHTKYDEFQTAFAMLALAEPLRKAFEELEEAKKRAAEKRAEAGEQRQTAAKEGDDDATGAGSDEFEVEISADAVERLQAATRAVNKEIEDIASATAAFGTEEGELQRMSFDERRRLGERLSSARMQHLARLVGAWRQYADGERRRKVQHVPSEVRGVKLGNDLTQLVPGELVNMAVPELQDQFWHRWAQHSLLLTDRRGTEKVGRGPIIVLCDESLSMASPLDRDGNTREMWSKAVALALADQARRDGRDFHYVGFASPGEQFHLPFPGGRLPIAQVVEFTEHFFRGGTSYVEPLQMAQQIVGAYARRGDKKPDIVMITDDECEVPRGFLAAWAQFRKEQNVRCYGVAVGVDGYRNDLASLADRCVNITKLNSDPEGLGELFREI